MMRFFDKLHTPKFYSEFASYLANDSIALLRKLPRTMDDLFLDAWNKSVSNEVAREHGARSFWETIDLCMHVIELMSFEAKEAGKGRAGR
jgi:hypothetical protein